MANEKLLIVDDELAIRSALRTAFSREHMMVWEASCGAEALTLLKTQEFDLIVLDIMMGDMDGYTILQKLRADGIMTPILMLSGRQEEMDQVLGLGLGADDYLTKPFHLSVLIQKAKALIRRNRVYSHQNQGGIQAGPFRFDTMKLECYKNGKRLNLTAKELVLFRFFLEHPGQVFTREQLYHQVWNENLVDDNTIMVYIKRIREKIEDDSKKPAYLKTVRGIGYIFNGKG
ncbi:DNA-binding response regulator [bacterium D16-54]|nr:DNA-binding response regulator [bacterium D16-54]RKJ13084.1 DNA-binding response regulator [bacterium D16-56]